VNLDTIGCVWIGEFDLKRYVWTGKFLNPERKSCGFKNIQIRVDGVFMHLHHCDSIKEGYQYSMSEERAFESLLLENYSSFTLTIDCNKSS